METNPNIYIDIMTGITDAEHNKHLGITQQAIREEAYNNKTRQSNHHLNYELLSLQNPKPYNRKNN